MNGLEIASRYFAEWGKPYLQQQFPNLAERVAAGIFRGSQVLGADDELSRDHGWGPMFLLLLTEEDYAAQGQAMAQALSVAAPQEWLGYSYYGLAPNIEISSVDRYLEHWLGFAHPPTRWQDWLGGTAQGVREYELYLIQHGQVFDDPLGAFSARRLSLAHYPRQAWLQRVWDELFQVWHYGQYNFLERLTPRGDTLAIQIALGHFIEATMRLCLLLDDDYTPYWKWLAFAFRQSPGAARLEPILREVAEEGSTQQRVDAVGAVCAIVHELLDEAGLASRGQGLHPHPLFRDQIAVHQWLEREQPTNDG